MNTSNFKIETKAKIIIELKAWANDEKALTVLNQFDESILESALENIDKLDDKKLEWWANSNAEIMSIAHAISEFSAPEIDGAWIN